MKTLQEVTEKIIAIGNEHKGNTISLEHFISTEIAEYAKDIAKWNHKKVVDNIPSIADIIKEFGATDSSEGDATNKLLYEGAKWMRDAVLLTL